MSSELAYLKRDLGRYIAEWRNRRRMRQSEQGCDYTNKAYEQAVYRMVEQLHPSRMHLALTECFDETPSTRTLRFERFEGLDEGLLHHFVGIDSPIAEALKGGFDRPRKSRPVGFDQLVKGRSVAASGLLDEQECSISLRHDSIHLTLSFPEKKYCDAKIEKNFPRNKENSNHLLSREL